MYELNDNEFQYISRKIYDYAKINLTEKKRSLVISRLSRRIRALGLTGFQEYIDYLETEEGQTVEFQLMVDALSTNYSLFFREPHHLDFLYDKILPESRQEPLNIWSAASSTGQEIYSILIKILEYQSANSKVIPCKLYASDISSQALTTASRGVYQRKDTAKIDDKILKKYFLSGTGSKNDSVKVKKDLIKKVHFFKLNLDDEIYHLPPMDIIFLRNVVIYFDKDTKIRLIDRLYNYLKPNGYLILGHSESLSGISDKFRVKGKTIYQRREL
ncbi:MAG: chemotaxis protein CheR [Spirochaetales bacterium]|nr:chemotaxis protein CheR [Spirochaetales bacterium]